MREKDWSSEVPEGVEWLIQVVKNGPNGGKLQVAEFGGLLLCGPSEFCPSKMVKVDYLEIQGIEPSFKGVT